MRVADRSRRQTPLDHLLLSGLQIQRSHCCQYSLTQGGPNIPSEHTFVVLAGLLSHPWLHGCHKPSVKVFVEIDLRAFQVATQITFAQLSCQIRLRFPQWAVDCSIVVFTLAAFVIAAEIDSDEPPAVASCNDLANFASHRDFLLGPQREAH